MQSAMLSGFALATLASSSSFPATLEVLQAAQFGPALIFAAKFALAWPFAYHALNGIRHLVQYNNVFCYCVTSFIDKVCK